MDSIIGVLSNPIVWAVVVFVAGIFLKKKRTTYLKLAFLLIEAIEVIDEDIADIVSDKKEAKLCKIKKWIKNRVRKDEGKVLNDILASKGLLKGTKD